MKLLKDMTLEELWELFPIILKEHNTEYKVWYEEEKQNLYQILGEENICRLSHIGSTAVEGLLAKPIVDILLEIPKNLEPGRVKEELEEAGWICMSESTEPELKLSFNKGYTQTGFAEKVFHLHVRHRADWGELYFRDYLMGHPKTAFSYAELKRGLKTAYEHNRDGYTQAKTEFVEKYTAKARKEFCGRYREE